MAKLWKVLLKKEETKTVVGSREDIMKWVDRGWEVEDSKPISSLIFDSQYFSIEKSNMGEGIEVFVKNDNLTSAYLHAGRAREIAQALLEWADLTGN